MAHDFFNMFGGKSKKAVSPTTTIGAPGAAVYGGYVVSNEKESALQGTEKYKTFSQILANVSIVAAGTRYFLNLAAKASWTFEPSEADTDGRFAKLAEEMLTKDPKTPWHRIIRRAAMYRFYGFSVQEWTARRREDGFLTYEDIAPRAQLTIERWDIDDKDGSVQGMTQRNPQNSEELYLPRGKVMYLVDDTLSDSPEGLGLFRHLVSAANRVQRYEQLEGFGFETDLRGIPVGRGPFTELHRMVTAGEITEAQRITAEAPIRNFVENHIKNPKLGMLLDSITYQSQDEAGTPSSTKQWDIELLRGDVSGQQEVADAINRLNQEMARILGVEGLLVGSGATGSMALSKDKSQNFYLVVDGTLIELRESIEDDLLVPIWELNGLDPALMPTLKTEAVRYQDVQQITMALRDMANAGAMLMPDDPAINDVRTLLGISRQDAAQMEEGMAFLLSNNNNSDDDDPEIPKDQSGEEKTT